MKKFSLAVAALAATALTACGGQDSASGDSRDAIHAVGSSTVFPFATRISEIFSRENPQFPAANIESIGTGGGIAQFCGGIGFNTPDIAQASRRMKPDEFATCQANGVENIVEIQVGMDGIALASAQGGITMDLTPEIVYRAIAANPYGEEQTAENWSDIDPSLPDLPILVYGPPSTSGTRDALTELILEVGCEAGPLPEGLSEEEEDRICTEVRSDGKYVDQGEQDNLIVQKIETNPNAVGIFGFSYLDANADRVQGLSMNGVAPTYENISNFSYPGARPLFIYLKADHIGVIPGLEEFLATWVANWGADGPLAEIGLVPNRDDVMAAMTAATTEFPTLTAEDLQ
ncbi:substrate-binding domain-containing protein [Erythrobacter sp. EC-HK427]|uniref:substrate-binding domain-containing protein n=1 Tax=Erythrobacter sp. EC-HK427 TaxID=2038396 RepID=UPI00125912B6|nr:substrate-binding domain-containing protein [Erythrobacter sp. EC-HK427]VVT14823.1 Phosphate ABC transporter substrate-binding protein [Erythrobacter sp. EC-HK427]